MHHVIVLFFFVIHVIQNVMYNAVEIALGWNFESLCDHLRRNFFFFNESVPEIEFQVLSIHYKYERVIDL